MLIYNPHFIKGLWLTQETYFLDKEQVVLLPEVLDVVGQKHGLAAALTPQCLSVLVQVINGHGILLLVSYAKDSMAQDPLNVIMVMLDLLMDSKKQKEEWKFVLMATGPRLVTVIGTLLQLA